MGTRRFWGAKNFVLSWVTHGQIVRNRWVHPFDAWGIKREGVVRRILRPFQFEMLAKTGDSQSGQILCEEGLEVKGEKHMFRMNALVY